MRLGQTSVVLTGTKFLGSITGFFATVYFARELGGSVLGQYALVLALVSWIGIVGDAGLSQAFKKRLSEGENQPEIIGAAITTLGTMFVLVSLGVVLFSTQVNAYVGRDVAGLVVLLLLMSLLTTVSDVMLHGTHLVHVQGVLSGLGQVIRAVAQIVLVLVGYGLSGMLFGYAFSGFVIGAVGIRYVGILPRLPNPRHIKSLFDFAKFAWLGNISNRAYTYLDIVVLGIFVSSTLVGVYSISWSIATFLTIFGRSIQGTFFPEMSRMEFENGKVAVRDLMEESLRYNGLIVVPGLVGALLLGDRLLAIYGPEFAQGTTVLAILVGAAMVYSYVSQFRNALTAIDRPDLAFKVNVVFLVVNIVLNVTLVIQFGWIGAAVATFLSAGIAAVMVYWYVERTIGVDLPLGSIGRQWFAALVMGVLVWGFRLLGERHVEPSSNALFVVVIVGAGAVIYLGILATIWPSFRVTVMENLPVNEILR